MDLSLNLGATKYSDGLCHRVAEKASLKWSRTLRLSASTPDFTSIKIPSEIPVSINCFSKFCVVDSTSTKLLPFSNCNNYFINSENLACSFKNDIRICTVACSEKAIFTQFYCGSNLKFDRALIIPAFW